MEIAMLACFCFIGAIWCALVASNKELNVMGYTLLGCFFPLIGIIAVHVAQPAASTLQATTQAQ